MDIRQVLKEILLWVLLIPMATGAGIFVGAVWPYVECEKENGDMSALAERDQMEDIHLRMWVGGIVGGGIPTSWMVGFLLKKRQQRQSRS